MKVIRQCVLLAALAMAAAPRSVLACATCFGQSDSGLAKGMNWGILSLLVLVVFVLGGISAFFIYLAKRAATTSGDKTTTKTAAMPETAKPI